MELKQPISERVLRTSLLCHICGDLARGMNFDVITCMSCKAFFRRHALRPAETLQCLLDNNCDIRRHTRAGCAACRLKKCFEFGMNPQLIRSPYKKPIKQRTIICLPRPQPISLLDHDRSTLTFDEWTILSNTIHAYDEQDLIIRTQCCLKQQSCLPPKLRSKKINTLDLIGSFYTAVQPFIERSPYFLSLPADIRKIIIQNNLNGTGAFNSLLAAGEANVFDNETHITMCNEIYGAAYVKHGYRLLTRMDSNRTLVKIMLIVLAFSSNGSIVAYDRSIKLMHISAIHSLYLLRAQNIFVTMLWKYLIYQYGYEGAVKRFNYLIKNYLDTLSHTHANVSTQHWEMVDNIVEKTAQSLTLNK